MNDLSLRGGLLAIVLMAITLLFSVGAANDLTHWEKVDNNSECYIMIETQRNLWFTPGERTETRTTYCKEKN